MDQAMTNATWPPLPELDEVPDLSQTVLRLLGVVGCLLQRCPEGLGITREQFAEFDKGRFQYPFRIATPNDNEAWFFPMKESPMQVRELLRRVMQGLQLFATYTTWTQVDDKAAAAGLFVVESDVLWPWIEGIINSQAVQSTKGEERTAAIMAAADAAPEEVRAAASAAGIEFSLIKAALSALVRSALSHIGKR